MAYRKPRLMLLLLIALSSVAQFCQAWDAVSHRLSAEIALEYLTDTSKQTLRNLLQHHPRYQQDFLAAMPAYIERANNERQLAWLLGQAAYWPDIARGLPESQRQQYNHPTWHYTDGAWTRDLAQSQGNVYLNRSPSPLQQGPAAVDIRQQDQVNNVMTALDYISRQLSTDVASPADKAVALCWFLHLAADIHQPLHAGSLFSTRLFANGDRGGNAINTDEGNLHYRWDSALSGQRISDTLQQINGEIDPSILIVAQETYTDWSTWLNESRDILRNQVYSIEIKQLILEREQGNRSLPDISLNPGYVQAMQNQSRQRLALAGLRIANWLDNNLTR